MSAGTRIPLERATELAGGIVEFLESGCTQIMVAGSVRRQRPTIGDIEIVCVPRVTQRTDLFGQVLPADGPHDVSAMVQSLIANGVFSLRPDPNGRTANGERHKRLLFHPNDGSEPIAVDLFCVLPQAQWGVIATIRTGSAPFSHKLVTPRLQSGWLPTGMQVRDGQLWSGGGRVAGAETERGFFEAVALPWLEPEQRTETVQLWRTHDEHSPVRLAWRDVVPA